MFPLPSLQAIKLIGVAVVVIGAGLAGAWLAHKVDRARYDALELRYRTAKVKAVEEAKAIQSAEDKVSLDRAVAEAAAQQKIVVQTQTITREISRHVTDHSDCITYGLVRVLDAGVLGRDPNSLPLPAGKSDNACAPVTAASLAQRLVTNFAAARANAEQLNALEAWIQAAIHASVPVSGH